MTDIVNHNPAQPRPIRFIKMGASAFNDDFARQFLKIFNFRKRFYSHNLLPRHEIPSTFA